MHNASRKVDLDEEMIRHVYILHLPNGLNFCDISCTNLRLSSREDHDTVRYDILYCTILYCKLWTQAIASKSTSKFSQFFYTTNRLYASYI